MTRTNALVYAVVAMAALALNSVMAAQYGPYEAAGVGPDPAYLYSDAVEQWRPAVDEACAVHGCSADYILGVMACESGGDPGAVGPHGELGLMQIDPAIWGTYGPVESIWFAAEHLTAGDIFWSCA